MTFKNIADQTNGFYIPCVSLFGPGCAKEVGAKAQNLGAKKALIVTDEGLFKFGVADLIVSICKNRAWTAMFLQVQNPIQQILM